MNKHIYDDCNGGICIKCNACKHPGCCPQLDECPSDFFGADVLAMMQENRDARHKKVILPNKKDKR